MITHLARTILAAALALGVAAAQEVPLRVVNALGAARTGEPVSFGVPLPRAFAVRDPRLLAVVDAEQRAIPCQIKALARWGAPRDDGAAALKWVLVTFAPMVGPRATAEFRLVVHDAPRPGPAGCVVTARDDVIEIKTDATTAFSVPTRAFAPLRSVAAFGLDLVDAPGRVEMADAEDRAVSAVVTEATRAEESGPQRVVLVQRGTLGDLAYTCRWTFHAGRADVALDFRLENPHAYGLFDGAPEGVRYFDRLELVQPVAGLTQEFEVTQDWRPGDPNDVLAGFEFVKTVAGARTASGRIHGGVVDVVTPQGGVTVAVERFRENYPKALGARDGAVRVALFPSFGHGPEFRGQHATPQSADKPVDPRSLRHYRFEGGRWKSHRVVFDFHAGARADAEIAAFEQRLAAPLAGHAAPAWVRASGAMGILWAERDHTSRDPAVERFERFLTMLVDDDAADATGRLGRIGLPRFLDRGGTYGGRQPYGWENFGDIPWGDGWSSLHYDWPAAVLSGYLRCGDPRLLARGRDLARYRRDMGQNHARDPRESWRGAQFYEKGWWHGNYMPGALSHNWLLGLLLDYAISGDEGSREAAVENAAFVLRASPSTWTGWWGSRIPGWAIDCLVDAWNFLGDPRYEQEAARAIRRYEELEIQDGAGGYHLNPANGTTTPWMENVLFIAAAKHVLATGSPQALPLLGRMRDWFKHACLVPPSGTPQAMTLPGAYEVWTPRGGQRPSAHHLWSMIASFSYAAVLLDDPDDARTAGMLFEFATRFWQDRAGSVRNPLNGGSWSPVTMRPLGFPNSESKVIANVLNYGAPYLALRR